MDILNKKQAARYLGCTTRHLERQISEGKLRAYKLSKKMVRLRHKDLIAYLERYAVGPLTDK